jgi:hypothetical protein
MPKLPRRFAVAALTLSLALAGGGCATMFAAGSEPISINSQPEGARVVTQTGQALGVTPFTTQMDPSRTYLLSFQKDGYTTTTFSLGRKVDGVSFLNLLCILCWGIDLATGAMWGLDTNTVNVVLTPQQAWEQLTPEQRGAVNFGVPAVAFAQATP